MSKQQSNPQQHEAYVLPHAMAQVIANYLATKPYREVANMIGALQTLNPVRAATSVPPDHSATVTSFDPPKVLTLSADSLVPRASSGKDGLALEI